MTERYTFSDAANAEDAFVRLRRWIAERSKMSVLTPGVWRVSVTGIVGNSAEADRAAYRAGPAGQALRG